MSVLPWPVESITECNAKEFFDRGIDLQYPGSWRINTKFCPRPTSKVRKCGTRWMMRFKLWGAASVNKINPNKVDQYKAVVHDGPGYPTLEEAVAHCYRDIYAKVHANVHKFKPRALVKRKNAMKGRDSRANNRSAQLEPDEAAKDLHDKKVTQMSRRSTLRPRNLRTETPKRHASSQQPDVQSKRLRVDAKPPMSKKQLRHQKQVQQLTAKAKTKIADATQQMQDIKEVYEKAETAMKGEYYCSSKAERIRDTHSELESGIMLSTLSKTCIQHLIKQIKSVYRYYVSEKQLWRQFLQSIETHEVGHRFPREPTLTSCLTEALRTQVDDTSALSAEKLPRKAAMRKYITHWQRNKSFKPGSPGRPRSRS